MSAIKLYTHSHPHTFTSSHDHSCLPHTLTDLVDFSDEEGYGKYFDLHHCYDCFVNLKQMEVWCWHCWVFLCERNQNLWAVWKLNTNNYNFFCCREWTTWHTVRHLTVCLRYPMRRRTRSIGGEEKEEREKGEEERERGRRRKRWERRGRRKTKEKKGGQRSISIFCALLPTHMHTHTHTCTHTHTHTHTHSTHTLTLTGIWMCCWSTSMTTWSECDPYWTRMCSTMRSRENLRRSGARAHSQDGESDGPSTSLSICLYLSIFLSIHLSIYLSISLSIWLSIYLAVYLSSCKCDLHCVLSSMPVGSVLSCPLFREVHGLVEWICEKILCSSITYCLLQCVSVGRAVEIQQATCLATCTNMSFSCSIASGYLRGLHALLGMWEAFSAITAANYWFLVLSV